MCLLPLVDAWVRGNAVGSLKPLKMLSLMSSLSALLEVSPPGLFALGIRMLICTPFRAFALTGIAELRQMAQRVSILHLSMHAEKNQGLIIEHGFNKQLIARPSYLEKNLSMAGVSCLPPSIPCHPPLCPLFCIVARYHWCSSVLAAVNGVDALWC